MNTYKDLDDHQHADLLDQFSGVAGIHSSFSNPPVHLPCNGKEPGTWAVDDLYYEPHLPNLMGPTATLSFSGGGSRSNFLSPTMAPRFSGDGSQLSFSSPTMAFSFSGDSSQSGSPSSAMAPVFSRDSPRLSFSPPTMALDCFRECSQSSFSSPAMAFSFSGDGSQSGFSSPEMAIDFSGDSSQSSSQYLSSPNDGDFWTLSHELEATCALIPTTSSVENYTCDYGDGILQSPCPLEPQSPPVPRLMEIERTETAAYVPPPVSKSIGVGDNSYYLTPQYVTPAISPVLPRTPNPPWTIKSSQTHTQHPENALPPSGVRKAKHHERQYCPLHPCKFGGSFRRKGDLVRHLRTQHPQSEDELHPCPFAGCSRSGKNGFFRRDKMLQHQDKVHGGRMSAEFVV